MEQSQLRREEALEELAAQAIRQAASFARAFDDADLAFPASYGTSFNATLARLRRGEAFDERDDIRIAQMEQVLVDALNTLWPGYGDRIRQTPRHETYDDVIFDSRVDALRWLFEEWRALRNFRDAVRARLAARRFLASACRSNDGRAARPPCRHSADSAMDCTDDDVSLMFIVRDDR